MVHLISEGVMSCDGIQRGFVGISGTLLLFKVSFSREIWINLDSVFYFSLAHFYLTTSRISILLPVNVLKIAG